MSSFKVAVSAFVSFFSSLLMSSDGAPSCRFRGAHGGATFDQSYCSLGENNLLCDSSFPAPEIFSVEDETEKYKDEIVEIHNNFRQRFAAGAWPSTSTPTSADMRKVTWSAELQKVAFAIATRGSLNIQKTVDTAEFHMFNVRTHDYDPVHIEWGAVNPNDNQLNFTPRTIFSYWIKLILYERRFTLEELNANRANNATWLPLVLMLTSEVHEIGCSYLKFCKGSPVDKDTSNETSIAKTEADGTEHYYSKTADNADEVVMFECAYGTLGPDTRRPNVYEAGETCSNCPSPTSCDSNSPDYPALCV